MWSNLCSLLKKDFRMMISSRFFLLAAGSLVLYSCYINFVYAKADQPVFPVYLYDPGSLIEDIPSAVIKVNSLNELKKECEDGYSVGLDMSGESPEAYLVSCGIKSLDNCRWAYAAAVLDGDGDTASQIIGSNDKEMKNRREMTAECLFFELAAVGFLGLAAMLFKEKQMGVIRVHSVLPLNRSAFILAKLGLILVSDLVFTVLLTFLNLGMAAGMEVLPAVLFNAGILSLIMALLGFICAVAVPGFKQFSLLYLVLAVFITTPVFLAGQTGVSLKFIKFHPMYYLFMAVKNAYFQEQSSDFAYAAACLTAVIVLFLTAKRGLDYEMAKEG